MKVLLIGNYDNLRSQSMQRFADMLRAGLAAAGHEVRVVRPPVWQGRQCRSIGLVLFLLGVALSQSALARADEVPSRDLSPYNLSLPLITSKDLSRTIATSAWAYRKIAEHLLCNVAGGAETAESPHDPVAAEGVIGWLLTESGSKGTWWEHRSKKRGDPNINRFVLLPLIDAIYRLHPPADGPDWAAWRAPLRAAVDFQVRAYEGKVDWDWGAKAGGHYPNQDVYYALILAIASRLFDEPRYQALADQMMDKLAGNLMPNGAFHYIGQENESPIYHALVQVILGRYIELTDDSKARSVLKKSASYWGWVMSDEGVAEAWSDVWWKQNWLTIPAAALTLSAKASGDPELKWREQQLLANQKPNGLPGVYARSAWDPALAAKRPSPRYLAADADIRGIRGKNGDWYYGLTAGRGLRNTFVGGMVSSPTSNPALQAAFRGAQIEVKRAAETQKPFALSQVSDRAVTALSAQRFGLLGVRYTLQPPLINGVPRPETPDSPWQTTQVWAVGDKGVLGTITLLSLTDNDAVLVTGRLPLGPGPVEQTGPSSWKCGPLKVRLYDKFGDPTIKAIGSAYPSPVSKWPGIEFSAPVNGMKQGDRFQYAVWIGPEDQPEPQELVPREDGTGWTVRWKGKAPLKVSFDPTDLRIEMK